MFRANNFDKLLDKATSNLRLDPDWPTILQICDLIRQNDVVPKYAVAAVKKKLYSQNPHQAMFALLTLESIVKNCGSGVHDEVTSKAFCESLRELVKTTQHENLRNKILELTQAWAFAFRNSPKYRAVQDIVNILKAECYKFPPLKESDAMFSADTAPEWADGEVCHRCRTTFTLMLRRHHCRACGQVFCQQCSSKTSTLPKFGIEKEVRVCDACYDKVSRPPSSSAKLEIVDTSNDYGPSQPQKKPGKSAEELQEEEELQLALALSQSEAEQKEKERKSLSRAHIAPEPSAHHTTVSPTPSSARASPEHGASAGSASAELSRYLDRNYWEQRLARDPAPPAPSASVLSSAPTAPASHPALDASDDSFIKPNNTSKLQEDDAEDKEIDEFVETLKSQVEIFVNRMKSNSSRGRSIANDTSVQTLFMNITAMHSRLLRYIQLQDDKRVYLESLQDKVTQVRDSRAALDTLRAEHAARLAAAAEAAERQRQLQMQAKLHAMRKKKHEYLQYQRQLALQRVQEQEREMQMRQEQQKHQYMMSANSGFYMPGVSMHQFQPGYPNQGIYANPQFHTHIMPQATTDGSVNMPGQSQMSQSNPAMGVNSTGTLPQSMSQIPNTFAMSTSGMTISQAPITTQSMMQPNVRQPMAQQLPMQQQQMIMQQMHQMRMAAQPGMHQIIPQNVNGIPGQNVPQQNSQPAQLPKQNLQQPGSIMPAISVGQTLTSQQQINPNNSMIGMQMRPMNIMPGNQSNNNPQMPSAAYVVPMLNPHNSHMQPPSLQSQNQIQTQQTLPGQMIPTQSLHGQTMQMPNNLQGNNHGQPPQPQGQQVNMQQQPITGNPMHLPSGQQLNMQGQQIPIQGQQIPIQGHNTHQQNQPITKQGQQVGGQLPQGQQVVGQLPQGQQVGGQLPQGQVGGQMPQGQQNQPVPHGPQTIPGSHMPQGSQMQMVGGITQQMPQGVQMQGQIGQNMNVQGPQLAQGQQFSQGQSMPITQGQSMPTMQGQPVKIQQPNTQQHVPNNQGQQSQTSVKSEHNNNTTELISFD